MAGDADLELRAIGHVHCNIKRIVGDLVWIPNQNDTGTLVLTSDPRSNWAQLAWMIVLIDNDDETEYSPFAQDVLSDEKVLAHGLMGYSNSLWSHPVGGTTALTAFTGYGDGAAPRAHIDVRSNRRLTGDNDIRLYYAATGLERDSQATDFGILGISLRALVKFPAGT